MPTKGKGYDSTTKKWASKPKTAKAKNLGTGGARKAADAIKKRQAMVSKY